MSNIEQHLLGGEEVVHVGKMHWIVFLGPAVLGMLAALYITAPVGPWLVLLAVVTSSAVAINYSTSEFAVTSKRVIAKAGVIRRTSVEVLLDKIEGLEVDQGILGRILGFGTVTVHGTGGTRSPFRNLQAPFEFRDRAQEQIASLQDPQ